ncbi:hypothetical protein [Skermanella stibiiresistens]|nr:hypothetical protein [Skermanella stibiiresistens]
MPRWIGRAVLSAMVACVLIQPAVTSAEETETHVCRTTDQIRRMDRIFEPGGVPCTVRYYRNDEPPKTLWQARETGQVCVDAIDKLKRDFEAAGYTCTGGTPGDQNGGTPGTLSGATGSPEAVAREGGQNGGQGGGQSAPASNLCYTVSYQACPAGQHDCRPKPASLCLQSDSRWLLTDGVPAGLDPASRFLPGEPGKCYRVYRDGQALPLCTETAGAPGGVWQLR